MTWDKLHNKALSALYALQVPCHGPCLCCDADTVGPLESGAGLSWAKAWHVQLLGDASGFVYVRGTGTLPWLGIVVFP